MTPPATRAASLPPGSPDALDADRSGWVRHGLGPDGQDSIEHAELTLDGELAAFCAERLAEELRAGVRRGAAGVRHAPDPDSDSDPDSGHDSVRDPRGEAGLRVLEEVRDDLARGVLPDDATLQLLLVAYRAHPDFRSRWWHPALLLPAGAPAAGPTGRPR